MQNVRMVLFNFGGFFNKIMILFQLLLKPKFSGIEKIKTIGSTYMTASGLRPGKEEGAMVSCCLY